MSDREERLKGLRFNMDMIWEDHLEPGTPDKDVSGYWIAMMIGRLAEAGEAIAHAISSRDELPGEFAEAAQAITASVDRIADQVESISDSFSNLAGHIDRFVDHIETKEEK